MSETAVAEKNETGVRTFDMALSEKLEVMKSALPVDFNKERFVQNALSLIHDNPKLKEYKQSEIMTGLIKGAVLGLDFMNKEAYLVPYKGTLQFQMDYRGAIKLAKKYSSRPVLDIYAQLVREGDTVNFAVKDGKQTVDFEPIPFNDNPVIGAFAVALYKDGSLRYDTMSLKELEATRSQSKQKDGIPWTKFTGEMYKKTVLHRLCKVLDIDFENPQQKNYFSGDMSIETDTENEIEESENSVDFEEENIIDVDAKDIE